MKMNKSQIIGIFVLSIVLRLLLLFSHQDMWHDDSFSVLFAEKDINYITDSNDVHPPVYYLFLKPIIAISDSEMFIRSISLSLWCIFFWVMYIFLKRNFSDKINMFTMLLLSLSPTMIYYSLEPRNYMLGMIFVIAQIYFFFELVKEREIKQNDYAFMLFSVLMLYTHYFTVFVLFVEALFILTENINLKKMFAFLYSIIFILTIPLIIYFLNTLSKISTFWFNTVTINSFLSTLVYLIWFPENIILLNFLMLISIIPAIVLSKPPKFIIAIFLIPVITVWLISQIHVVYHHRFFLFYAPFYYMLISSGFIFFIYSKNKIISIIGGIFWIIFIWISFVSFIDMLDNPKDQLYKSQEYIKQHDCRDIVHTSPFSFTPYNYYFKHDKCYSNYLMTDLNEKELFTFGGAVIDKRFIINNTDNLEKFYIVTDKKFNEQLIWNDGGLMIYEVKKTK